MFLIKKIKIANANSTLPERKTEAKPNRIQNRTLKRAYVKKKNCENKKMFILNVCSIFHFIYFAWKLYD